jgi:hypothetical protein
VLNFSERPFGGGDVGGEQKRWRGIVMEQALAAAYEHVFGQQLQTSFRCRV